MKIIGIDPSLTATGIAVVDTQDRLHILTHTITSKGHRDDSWAERCARINVLARRIIDTAEGADHVVIESPSLGQQRQGGALDRAGLWWAILTGLHRVTPITAVPPATRAKYATGKGNAGKDAVLLAVAKRYPQADIEDNNQADALALAAIGARLAGEPIEDSIPRTHRDALVGLMPEEQPEE